MSIKPVALRAFKATQWTVDGQEFLFSIGAGVAFPLWNKDRIDDYKGGSLPEPSTVKIGVVIDRRRRSAIVMNTSPTEHVKINEYKVLFRDGEEEFIDEDCLRLTTAEQFVLRNKLIKEGYLNADGTSKPADYGVLDKASSEGRACSD